MSIRMSPISCAELFARRLRIRLECACGLFEGVYNTKLSYPRHVISPGILSIPDYYIRRMSRQRWVLALLGLCAGRAGGALARRAPRTVAVAVAIRVRVHPRLMCTQPRLIADIQVLPSPSGVDGDEFAHVDAAIAAISASGLDYSVNALGTTIEGDADKVWATARAAFDACLASGADKEVMLLKVYQGSRSAAELQASGQAASASAASASVASASTASVAADPRDEGPKAAPLALDADPVDAERTDPDAATKDDGTTDDGTTDDGTTDDGTDVERSVDLGRGFDKTMLIHPGSRELPPLVQVPGGSLPLTAVVKPPDADVLWQWEESRGNIEADTSWASVWPAAANLAALLSREPSLVENRRVAELGSGLGIAGLTAAKCGAATVTLIDREALALHCAMSTAVVCGLETGPVPDGSAGAAAFYAARDKKTNAREGSGGGGVVSASMADWGALAAAGLAVDVVLASEVLYDPKEAAPLARSAARLLKTGGTLLLADPAAGRVATARAAAADALRELGARVSEAPLPAPPAGDGWYTLRAGDGKTSSATPSEEIVLLRADFDAPPLA